MADGNLEEKARSTYIYSLGGRPLAEHLYIQPRNSHTHTHTHTHTRGASRTWNAPADISRRRRCCCQCRCYCRSNRRSYRSAYVRNFHLRNCPRHLRSRPDATMMDDRGRESASLDEWRELFHPVFSSSHPRTRARVLFFARERAACARWLFWGDLFMAEFSGAMTFGGDWARANKSLTEGRVLCPSARAIRFFRGPRFMRTLLFLGKNETYSCINKAGVISFIYFFINFPCAYRPGSVLSPRTNCSRSKRKPFEIRIQFFSKSVHISYSAQLTIRSTTRLFWIDVLD